MRHRSNTHSSAIAWLPGNETENLPSAVPQFWAGQKLTWSVIARVDGKAYSLFGVPNPGPNVEPASVISGSWTATHTTFVVTAGSASFVLEFMSPISPQDHVRQSMPFSYLTISVSGFGGKTPSVQVYSDIDNSWAGQFGVDVALGWNWALTAGGTVLFTLTPGGAPKYSEDKDMAQWGSAVYGTTPNESNVTSHIGQMDATRADFVANGRLTGEWKWTPGSVVAHTHDLGSVGGPSTPKNVTYVVGFVRDEAINYMGNPRSNYWRSACNDINCAVVRMDLDFESADIEARLFDVKLNNKATAAGGAGYADILALSARQAFGAIDITIPHDSLSTNDVMIFMKEISRSVTLIIHLYHRMWKTRLTLV